MMLSLTGCFLRSLSSPPGDYFDGAVVCIAEHNEQGAVGFLVNRLFPRRLNELTEFAHLSPFPLYEGGPVDEEHLYFFHRRPDLIEGGAKVSPGVYFGGDFRQVTEAMEAGLMSEADIRLFVGYCGWNRGELEREQEVGGWEETDFILFRQ